MPIELKKTVAHCKDVCAIEEAETLLGWLLDKPKAKVNLKQMQHMHTAVLQVLIANKVTISSWPDDAKLKQYMQWALQTD
jgi:hypothetical protein